MVNTFLLAAVNRLSPLITRRTGPLAAALPREAAEPFAGTDAAAWLDDLKLFATGWIGGLVFFGTLIG
jgi:pseudouridine-5'-phosphate glycosidase